MSTNDRTTVAKVSPAWGTLVATAAALIAIGALVFFASADAQDSDQADADNHVTVLRDDGRFTGPGVWPPQPRTAQDPLEGEAGATDRSTQRSAHSVVADLMALRPEVATELGDAYSLISAANPPAPTAEDKRAVDTNVLLLRWFSRSNNQTVEVHVVGGEPSQITTIEAGDGQPELSAAEHELAIELATDHWREQYGSEVDDMAAFAIFELQEDGTVHDVRMAYVSFHDDPRAVPELVTWVDLTNEQIVADRDYR